ncbi:MAG: AmmeMemoRadiSam system radical SAM enzyme [Patescibacteria group bacterium]
MKECINYVKIKDDILQCQNCSHFCHIPEGNTGICGIRKNIKGKLYLLAYGRAIAANIDPIEKKPLYHFYPDSEAYSFGTLGCNFSCGNCQNFDISQMFGQKRKAEKYGSLEWGYPLSPEKIVKEAKANNCKIIAFTYNEPTIWVEYALDTMKIAKKEGLKNVWVSNGFMSPKTLDAVIPYLDAINVDIKSLDNEFYRKNCAAKIDPILENCKTIIKKNVWLEITTLIIPGMSDSEEMLKRIARFIKNELGDHIPWHITAFFGTISWKLKNVPSTTKEKIRRAYKIGKEEGLKYVYAGNIIDIDNDMEDTFCPKCGFKVIDRTGYDVEKIEGKGECPKCGTVIKGRF